MEREKTSTTLAVSEKSADMSSYWLFVVSCWQGLPEWDFPILSERVSRALRRA
jgi:hypothetical protein